MGLWLKALLGYNGNPALLEVIAYPLYLALALWYFVAQRPQVPAVTPAPAPASTQGRLPEREAEPPIAG